MGERIRERQTKLRKHVLCVCSVKSLLSSVSLPWSCRNIHPGAPAREQGDVCSRKQERRGEVGISSLPPCLPWASLACAQPPACSVHVVSFSWQVAFAASETANILESLRCRISAKIHTKISHMAKQILNFNLHRFQRLGTRNDLNHFTSLGAFKTE